MSAAPAGGGTAPAGGRPAPSAGADLDRLFQALSDGTRRALVERLAQGPASVSTLAEPLPMSLPAVTQHLGVLEQAGLVTSAKTGRVRTYRLVPDAVRPALAWLDRHRLPAEQRLDRLAALLDAGD